MSSISKQLSSITGAISISSGKKTPPPFTEIRLVVLGKTGSGKSSTGNTILGRKAFDSRVGSSSITQRCRRASADVRGRQLTVLDTPGLLDTTQSPQDVQKELRRSVSLLYPGPHVFLLIIHIGRFTQEDKEALRQIKKAMGSQALCFSIVVFTHGDRLEEGTSVKQCLIDSCGELAELVTECGGRYCVFNNHSSKTKEQVCELLGLVDGMMRRNEGNYYNSKHLQKAEEDLAQEQREEMKVLSEKEELLKKKQEAAIKERYEKEFEVVLEQNRREVEELRRKQELEKRNKEKLMRDGEEALRQATEENNKREKEWRIKEMVRVMEIRQEEENKREALQEKLDKVTKMLEEQAEQEERMRGALEEKMQKERVENLMKERERELQQIQKEQAIRQREEMKREALQKEMEKLIQSLEEQCGREEDRKKQMTDALRHERAEIQRERNMHMEKQMEEKRKTEALKRELSAIKTRLERQRASDEGVRRQLEESLRGEREKHVKEICMLKKQCEEKCGESVEARPAKKHCMVTTVSGYVQEMGLMGLNAALESIGAPCCIQ